MKKRKRRILYLIILLLFMLDVCFITINYLVINKDISGKVVVNNKYSNVLFGNVYIDNESNISVKLKDNMSINASINNLELVSNNELFYFDLVNTGNIGVSFDSGISNYNSNINSNLLSINTRYIDNYIGPSETKRIYVYFDYIGNEMIKNSYLNFNINTKIY